MRRVSQARNEIRELQNRILRLEGEVARAFARDPYSFDPVIPDFDPFAYPQPTPWPCRIGTPIQMPKITPAPQPIRINLPRGW